MVWRWYGARTGRCAWHVCVWRRLRCALARLTTAAARCLPRPSAPARVVQSVAAMHTLPSMVRSFTGRSSLQRSQSDSLLVEGRQLSDGSLAGPGRGGGPSRHSTAQHSTAQHSAAQRSTASASFLPNKPSQAAGAALASISVMVGAGVQPSCRSMPNLHTLSSRPSLPAGSQRPSQADAWQHSSQAEAQQQPGVGLEAGGVPAAGRDPRWSDPQAAAAPGLAPLQRQPSRLGRAAGAGGSFGGEGRGSAEAPPGQPQPQRQLAGQLSRTLSPTGAAMEQVAAAAARPELRASLASLQTSALSSLPAARQSYAFRVREAAVLCCAVLCCAVLWLPRLASAACCRDRRAGLASLQRTCQVFVP